MHETHFPQSARDPHPRGTFNQERLTWTCRSKNKSDRTQPLAGKVAVVTGSTSGIGLGIARALAAGGRRRRHQWPRQARGRSSAFWPSSSSNYPRSRIVYNGANLMKGEEAAGLVDQTIAGFGRVDILVNNAGIQHVSPIEDFPTEKYEAIIALNLSAAWYTTRAAFAAMKQNGFGRIINVASAHGLVASPFKSAYVAAKHGVVGLTKTVALEGAEHNVTCNAICPGYVWTPLVENQIDDTAKARGITREQVIRDVLLAAQPNKRFAEVEELGALAVFLCGPGGRSITGHRAAGRRRLDGALSSFMTRRDQSSTRRDCRRRLRRPRGRQAAGRPSTSTSRWSTGAIITCSSRCSTKWRRRRSRRPTSPVRSARSSRGRANVRVMLDEVTASTRAQRGRTVERRRASIRLADPRDRRAAQLFRP